MAVVRWYLEEGVAAGFRWSCGGVLGCLGGLVVSRSSPAGLLVVSWCPGGRGRHGIALSLFAGSWRLVCPRQVTCLPRRGQSSASATHQQPPQQGWKCCLDLFASRALGSVCVRWVYQTLNPI